MKSLNPMFKYQGGKRREWPKIQPYIPASTARIVEPFAGGAAVSWLSGLPALIADNNHDLTLTYIIIKREFSAVKAELDKMQAGEDEYLYHRWRINNPLGFNLIELVASWIYVRQQCFSGLIRYNKEGKFNVPWGRYKKFSHNVTQEHSDRLQTWTIRHRPWQWTVKYSLQDGDFLFLDPPYFGRNSCYGKNQTKDDQLHVDLAEFLLNTSTPFLLIHNDCEFYRDLYPPEFIRTEGNNYSMQFGKNQMKDRKVNHLYISNV